MSNETAETKTNNNAQDGDAELLSTKDSPAIAEILQEVESDLESVGEDPSSLAAFLTSEFTTLGRSLLRCGYLVQQIDEKKLYKAFGFSNTASLLEATFGLKASVVSRFRSAYSYALPISQAVPEVTIDDLNEAQMRELRGAIKALHPSLKRKQQIDKAVELYKEIHDKNSCPSSSDIAKFCEGKIADKKQKEQPDGENNDKPNDENTDESNGENTGESNGENTGTSGDDKEHSNEETHEAASEADEAEGFIISDKELGEPLEPIGDTRADDYIGTQLAKELSLLLGMILENGLIQDDIKERMELAFEGLGIEPVFTADAQTEEEDDNE